VPTDLARTDDYRSAGDPSTPPNSNIEPVGCDSVLPLLSEPVNSVAARKYHHLVAEERVLLDSYTSAPSIEGGIIQLNGRSNHKSGAVTVNSRPIPTSSFHSFNERIEQFDQET
jgi:hypothetical protein